MAIVPFDAPQPHQGPGDASGQQIEQFGRALEQAGGTAAELGAMWQEDIDRARVKEAVVLWNNRARDVVRAYRQEVGKAAVGERRKSVETALEDAARKLESQLDNDLQRGVFHQAWQSRFGEVRGQIAAHHDEQARTYRLGETQAMLLEAQESAVDALEAKNPTVYQRHKSVALEQARLIADEAGLEEGSTQRRRLIRDTTSGIHEAAVGRLLELGRTSEARDYLAQIDKSELTQAAKDRLYGTVRRASVQEEGARLAVQIRDRVLRQVTLEQTEDGRDLLLGEEDPAAVASETLQVRGVNMLQAQYEAGKISVELRDSATAELERLAKVRRLEELERETRVSEEAEEWLIKNPYASALSMPAELLEEAYELNLVDDLIAFANSGHRYTTDRAWFADLYTPEWTQRMRTMPQREFVALARRRTSPADFQAAMRLYAAAQPDPKDATTTLGPEDHVREVARRVGIDPKKHPGKYYLFHENAQRRWQQLEARLGRKATTMEIAAEVNAAGVDTVYLDVWGSDPEVVLASLTAEERERALKTNAYVEIADDYIYLRRIPAADRALITDALHSMGIPVTQREIARQWLLRQQREGGER